MAKGAAPATSAVPAATRAKGAALDTSAAPAASSKRKESGVPSERPLSQKKREVLEQAMSLGSQLLEEALLGVAELENAVGMDLSLIHI